MISMGWIVRFYRTSASPFDKATVVRKTLHMQSVIERYYNVNKRFLRKIGRWPDQNKLAKILIPVFILAVSWSIIIPQFLRLLTTKVNMDAACESVIILLICIGLNVKLLTVIFNSQDMEQLLSLIEYHWSLFTHSTELEILRDYAIFNQKMTIGYIVIIYTVMLLYMTIPITPQILDLVKPINGSRPHKFLFDIHYNFDRDDYYYVVLFHTYLATVLTITVMVTVDTMYMSYAQHGCGLFAAVGYQLEHITSCLDKNHLITSKKKDSVFLENACGSKNDTIYEKLIQCLRKHQMCIQFINLLDSSFGLYSILLLLINLLAASLLGIQIIISWDHKEEVLRYMGMFIGAFTHLFFLSYAGEKIMNHSLDIFHKAYNAEWYRVSRRTTRLLNIFLLRSIQPCKLTAGKIIVLSMSNYLAVLRMSMSYFTTLLTVR